MRLEGFLASDKLTQVREHKIYFSWRATICRKYPVCKKRAAPGRVFLRFQKPTQPARNGSSETLRECVRLEGFLGSVKLTQGSCEVRLKNIAVLL